VVAPPWAGSLNHAPDRLAEERFRA
jgi:hypothetical protein